MRESATGCSTARPATGRGRGRGLEGVGDGVAEVEAEGGEVGGESEDRREFDGGGGWTGSDGLLWAGSGVGLEQSFGELKGGSIRDPEVAGEEEGQEEWFERLLRDGAAAGGRGQG